MEEAEADGSQLQFQLLPIRDWNGKEPPTLESLETLQFQLLPIRDWNSFSALSSWFSCRYNFSYSLLGIETD